VSSATGEPLLRLSPPSTDAVTSSTEFSPDGKLLVTGDCSNTYTSMVAAAHVWDSRTGRLLATLGGHSGRVLASRFSADGKILVTAGWDALRVWEPRSGKPLRTLEKSPDSTTLLAVSPNGRRAISALRNTNRQGPLLACWDLTTGERVPLPSGSAANAN
jgi:WD40 repeat protein